MTNVLNQERTIVAPFPERYQAIQDCLTYMRNHKEEVLSVLLQISNHCSAVAEYESSLCTLEGALAEMNKNKPPKVEQMAVFMPSNVILYSYVLYLLIPSLFVDRIIFRPSSYVGSQMKELDDLLKAVHKLPIQLEQSSQRKFVKGTVAESDIVVFTGTYQNAEIIKSGLRKEQLYIFFGQGVNPFIVEPDANLSLAVEDAVKIRLLNSGQDCMGPDVFFVHESVSDEFVERLKERLSQLKFGVNTDPEADYGSIYYTYILETLAAYLNKHMKYIVHGGVIDFARSKMEPTVLYSDFEEAAEVDEYFAPIFNVVRYKDEQKLKELLHTSYYRERAMGASIYGSGTLIEFLKKRHTVTLNQTLGDIEDGNAPFGGYGPMANYVYYQGELLLKPILISEVVSELIKK